MLGIAEFGRAVLSTLQGHLIARREKLAEKAGQYSAYAILTLTEDV
jgi:hypothetical protein